MSNNNEINFTPLPPDSKKVFLFCEKSSSFLEGNLNKTSLNSQLCMIFRTIFKFDLIKLATNNNSDFNILNQNVPSIIYGGIVIKKDFIYSFLKSLVFLDEGEDDYQYCFMEKRILFDFQSLVDLYVYFDYQENTTMLWKVIKVLCQPWKSYKTYRNDLKLTQGLRDLLGVTNKRECLRAIENILIEVEKYLLKKGEYFLDVGKRKITALDLLLYSAFKTLNVLQIIYECNNKLFPKYTTFSNNFDKIISNDLPILNQVKILSPLEIDAIIPKIILPESKFQKYLDCPMDTPEIIQRTNTRKKFISVVFFGCLLVFKFSFFIKNQNFKYR
jgi:hypothetical protein